MSAIATVLQAMGHTVTGSDLKESAVTDRLRRSGINVEIGHQAGNVGTADALTVSTAVAESNQEVVEARRRGVPVLPRAQTLAAITALRRCIAVAGTHGKTTTASMLALILVEAGMRPSFLIGGEVNEIGTNAVWDSGEWIVVEADESDGTFLSLVPDIAIVTNVDAEHLDHFKTFQNVQDAFVAFMENVPFYGFVVMCTDHPIVQRLVGRVVDRRIITYGENPQADVRLVDLDHAGGKSHFSVLFRDRDGKDVDAIRKLELPMPGRHNALNATSAIAVAHELKIPDEKIRKALANFGGVKRRFTRVGEWNGTTIIDDYGHHPVEIAAVLRAARESTKGQVIAVVQPHRYTRLKTLFEPFSTCFNDADAVIVAHVYPAGEAPIEGADRDHLVAAIRARGHRQVIPLDGPEQLSGIVKGLAKPGDYVVCLGAGSITQWAYALPAELKAL
jgi:UDP-N-acetylmuramate--alanine ligase